MKCPKSKKEIERKKNKYNAKFIGHVSNILKRWRRPEKAHQNAFHMSQHCVFRKCIQSIKLQSDYYSNFQEIQCG